MNELTRFVSLIFDTQECRIMDRNGNPWFVLKDTGQILGIKNYRDAVRRFPDNEKGVVLTDTPGGPQKTLIINADGLMRLIGKSRKPQAEPFKDRINKFLADIINQGFRRAALPRVWYYRGQMLNHPEWMAKKEAAYMKHFPDASYEDFLRSLPPIPPVPPEGKDQQEGKDE